MTLNHQQAVGGGLLSTCRAGREANRASHDAAELGGMCTFQKCLSYHRYYRVFNKVREGEGEREGGRREGGRREGGGGGGGEGGGGREEGVGWREWDGSEGRECTSTTINFY